MGMCEYCGQVNDNCACKIVVNQSMKVAGKMLKDKAELILRDGSAIPEAVVSLSDAEAILKEASRKQRINIYKDVKLCLIDFVNWFDRQQDRPTSPIVTKDIEKFVETKELQNALESEE